jgi:hypothetical protein
MLDMVDLKIMENKKKIPQYTLYIDENGHCNMNVSPNNRFLSLTAIILENNYDEKYVKNIFKTFKNNYKIKGILHRSDIINRSNGFEFLVDDKIRSSFDIKLLSIIQEIDFKCITVVLDKETHLNQYGKMHKHPYHYCLECIMERFALFCQKEKATGRILIEARGKVEDKALKMAYEGLYKNGSSWVSGELFQAHITNSQIKLLNKDEIIKSSVNGLELCDIIGHASMQYIRKINNLPYSGKIAFGKDIQDILVNQKYHRSDQGKIKGFGIKLLP